MPGRPVVRRLRTALLFGCMLLAMRHPVVASPLNEAAPRSARQVVAAMFLVSSLALFTGKRGWAFEPAPFTREDSPWLQQFTTDLPPQELKNYGEQLFKLKALLAFSLHSHGRKQHKTPVISNPTLVLSDRLTSA